MLVYQRVYSSIGNFYICQYGKGDSPLDSKALSPNFVSYLPQISWGNHAPNRCGISRAGQLKLPGGNIPRWYSSPPSLSTTFSPEFLMEIPNFGGEMNLFYLFGGSCNKANLGMILRITMSYMSYCHVKWTQGFLSLSRAQLGTENSWQQLSQFSNRSSCGFVLKKWWISSARIMREGEKMMGFPELFPCLLRKMRILVAQKRVPRNSKSLRASHSPSCSQVPP
jgi:hypothetical protein